MNYLQLINKLSANLYVFIGKTFLQYLDSLVCFTPKQYILLFNWLRISQKTFFFCHTNTLSFSLKRWNQSNNDVSWIFFFNIFFSWLRGGLRMYKLKLKMFGLRYRLLSLHLPVKILWLNIGLSHLVGLSVMDSLILKITRHKKQKLTFCLKAIDLYSFKQLALLLRRFRGPNIFTGKGIRILGERFKLKIKKRRVR